MRRRGARIATVGGLTAFVACADSEGRGLVDADTLPRLAIVEVLRIGSADNPDTGFAAIAGVTVDRDGNVYAFEPQRVHLRVYDSTGILRRTIGRKGTGPGEFESAPRFGVVGDTVWAYDAFRRRMAMYNRQGEVLVAGRINGVSVDLQRPGSVGFVVPRWMRSDGTFIGQMGLYTSRRATEPWTVKATDTVRIPRLVFDATGAVVDTLGWEPYPPRPTSSSSSTIEIGGTRYSVPRASTIATSEPLPDGRVEVDLPSDPNEAAGTFSVTRIGLDGDTIYHRRFRYEPLRYDAALLDSLVWRSVRTPGASIPIVDGIAVPRPTRPDSMAAFDAIRAALRFPDHQPPVTYFTIRGDGEVWLERAEGAVGGPRQWMWIAADGTVRGQIELPRGQWVEWSGGDTIWVEAPDETDVPWLVKYRIAPHSLTETR